MIKSTLKLLVLLLCPVLFAGQANAQLVFGVPPQKNTRTALVTYSPLVDYLSRLTAETIEMRVATGWFDYQSSIKSGEYDFLITEPHIVGWLMDKRDYEPLVKLPSLLKYLVVVPVDNLTVNGPADLVTQIVCSRPPPSLGILLFYETFDNPLQQPSITNVNGGDVNVLAGLYAGECDAALLSSSFHADVLNDAQRSLLRVVLETRGMINEALVASPDISFETKDRIIDSLTNEPSGIAATEKIRDMLDSSAQSMVPANMLEYSGLSELLEDQSFGW
ncbi:MAG: hypothetical protein DWQ08_09075 [Proteobacteria bacterium]|nr:MAG: hypothetical protein DWQ08_09075 [Pseudomonadota bacterium]